MSFWSKLAKIAGVAAAPFTGAPTERVGALGVKAPRPDPSHEAVGATPWWKSEGLSARIPHHHRSAARAALTIASAILFMPSGRFEPKPA